MNSINTYLTFKGNCEEVFNFYKSIFKEEFSYLSRFKDMPQDNPERKIDTSDLEKIMHISLPIGNTVLMGSDVVEERANEVNSGNNFSLSINAHSKEEADRLFKELSENGGVIMPMANTFWDSYFGMCTDKYGIQWMVSFMINQN